MAGDGTTSTFAERETWSRFARRSFLSEGRRSVSNMGSSSREEVVAAFDALQATLSRLQELSFDALTTPNGLRCSSGAKRLGASCPASNTHWSISSPSRPARRS
ncbi:hypothetical protein BZL30_0546 [Mycobacterium kansasii]|uniref:Uncharacterized protein n=1 Tax=Mycobacterium kansasii TaxID=1768 RepID=A0A1V3XQZ8_MYCKA|nr:hypothetical protein BZL30_0546 [Mycobacterium kansasii]